MSCRHWLMKQLMVYPLEEVFHQSKFSLVLYIPRSFSTQRNCLALSGVTGLKGHLGGVEGLKLHVCGGHCSSCWPIPRKFCSCIFLYLYAIDEIL